MAASNVALAASGTVALELAHAGVPSVIGYKLPWATYQVLKRMGRRIDRQTTEQTAESDWLQ